MSGVKIKAETFWTDFGRIKMRLSNPKATERKLESLTHFE